MQHHIQRAIPIFKTQALGAVLTAAMMLPAHAAGLGAEARRSASTTTQSLQTFAIRPNSDAALGFQTLPGARCAIANSKGEPFVFYADAYGNARFHVRPAAGARESLALSVQCAARGVTAVVPLALRIDPRAATPRSSTLPANAMLRTIGPSGFDPAHASRAELQRYGYPPRPTVAPTTRGFAAWLRAVTTPAFRTSASVEHPDTFMSTRQTSDHWSGFEHVDALHSQSAFFLVIGEWTVPAVSMLGYLNHEGYSSIWAGIDGHISQDVVQAGTTQQAAAFCSFFCYYFSSYWAWYEFYPDDSKGTFSVNPGDEIFSESWMTNDSNGIPVGNFYVIDLTTHQSSYNTETMPTYYKFYPQFMGNSAEWILERPRVDGNYPPLPYYDWAYFSVALSERQNHETAYYLSEANVQDDMVGYQLLSSVAPIDFESMLFSWIGYQ